MNIKSITLVEKWIIGDVHGCLETLKALVSKLPDKAELVFVGDLIDRGPDSRGVINFVRDNGHECVQGNHEVMMIDAIEDVAEWGAPIWQTGWVDNGGGTTLSEYEDAAGNIDNKSLQDDYQWMLDLPVMYVDTKVTDSEGRCLLVSHSASGDNIEGYIEATHKVSIGISEDITAHQMIDFEHQVSNIEMITLWDRRVPKNIQTKFFNVFGHTPIDSFAFKGGIGGYDKVNGCLTEDNVVVDKIRGYANIDSGCVYPKNRYGKYRGSMTAISFPGLEVIQQENIDV